MQGTEELKRRFVELDARFQSGGLSKEDFDTEKLKLDDKLDATDQLIEAAAKLNTIQGRQITLGDEIRKPNLLRPLGGLGQDTATLEGVASDDARYDKLARSLDAFLASQAETSEPGGPTLARGSRARTLLNKYLRPTRQDLKGADIRATLTKDDMDFLHRPRTDKLMNAYVDRDGGFIVAEEMSNEMIALRELTVGIQSRFRVINTNALLVSFPTAAIVFNFQKRDKTGQGAITTIRLDDVFGKTQFQPAGRDVILKVPEQLVEDATFDLVAFLAQEANRVSNEEDELLGISGSGSGEPLGYITGLVKLFESLTTAQKDGGRNIGIKPGIDGVPGFVGAELNPEFIQVFDTYILPATARTNAVWTGPPAFERRVRLFRTEAGGSNTGEFMWKRALVAGAPNTLNSFPMLISQFFPDNFDSGNVDDPLFHLGDLGDYWWVTRSGLRVRVLDQLYAEDNEIGYKWQKRQDGSLVRGDGNIFGRRQP